MGWDNPPVPWRELQRRMSWRAEGQRAEDRPRSAEHVDPPEPGPPLAGSRPREATIPWAELHCHSSFSFLDGAATPGELVAEAARLGLEVLALTDHDGMYGVPQFAQAAAGLSDRDIKLGTVFGAELSLGLPSPGGTGGRVAPPCAGGSGGSPPRTSTAVTCWCWPATRKGTGGCAR